MYNSSSGDIFPVFNESGENSTDYVNLKNVFWWKSQCSDFSQQSNIPPPLQKRFCFEPVTHTHKEKKFYMSDTWMLRFNEVPCSVLWEKKMKK